MRIRDDVRNIAAHLNLTIPGTIITEPKKKDNKLYLASGTYGVIILKKENTQVLGSPGTIVAKKSTIKATATAHISNVYFKDAVEIEAGATTIFNNCVFDKLINMASGAKANFLGCSFKDDAAINNAGADATLANNLGCSRTSGVAHTNSTTFGETT